MKRGGLGSGVPALRELTGDLRQLASVRRITLDDGAERGLRALAFSTGGGLDFWVLADRSMDIGPLWHAGTPVAFEHPTGYVAPALHDRTADGGTAFERILSGFLVTGGLDHIRQPQDGFPLHGNLPLTPARVLSCGEDWGAAVPILHAEGEVTTAHLKGAAFRLTRRITAPIGGTAFRITDRVENIGTDAQPLGVLHHINFGFPTVAPGTVVRLDGEDVLTAGPDAPQGARCFAAGKGGRAVAELVRPATRPWGGLHATITSRTAAQPFVQVWSDLRARRNLIAIEPCTSMRRPDGTSEPGPVLAPGERWHTTLDFTFAHPAAAGHGETHGNR